MLKLEGTKSTYNFNFSINAIRDAEVAFEQSIYEIFARQSIDDLVKLLTIGYRYGSGDVSCDYEKMGDILDDILTVKSITDVRTELDEEVANLLGLNKPAAKKATGKK